MAMPRVSRGHGVELIRAAVVVLVVARLLLVLLLCCRCFGLLRALGEGRGRSRSRRLGKRVCLGCGFSGRGASALQHHRGHASASEANLGSIPTPSTPEVSHRHRSALRCEPPRRTRQCARSKNSPVMPNSRSTMGAGVGGDRSGLAWGGGHWPSSPRCDRRELLATRQVVLSSA